MKKSEPAKYPASRCCTSLKKAPSGKAEEGHFDQETHHARDTDARCAAIAWHAEYAPDESCKKWQTNGQEEA
jgi:hypothetical protein